MRLSIRKTDKCYEVVDTDGRVLWQTPSFIGACGFLRGHDEKVTEAWYAADCPPVSEAVS